MLTEIDMATKGGILAEPERITVDEIKRRMDTGEPILFIDLRNHKAWSESDVKLPGAVRIPLKAIEQRVDELPHDRLIIPYCT